MNAEQSSSVDKALKLDYATPEEIWLTNQNTLRKLVGVLGILLPVLVWVFVYVVSGHAQVLSSISHYYYTRANGVFTIVVSLLAIFLIIYKGKQPLDFYISSIGGLFALFLLLFPTSNLHDQCPQLCAVDHRPYAVTFIKSSSFRELFHYLSAAIFLLSMAVLSLFVFTKSNKPKEERTSQKKMRNKVYIVCGIVMTLAILVVFPGGLIISEDYYDSHHLTFWMETIAIEAFGFSWIVKAEMILKDK